jgi:uncharacterized protein with NAD-binding domain and iron-sulfur cluster
MSSSIRQALGGGYAGLCAAKTLAEAGVDFMLLEASDGLGGRQALTVCS